jgi:hypothetical protein
MFLKPGTLRTATGGPGPERLMGRGGWGGPRAWTAGVGGGCGTRWRDADFPLPAPFPLPALTRRGRGPGPQLRLGLGPVPRRRRRQRGWGRWRRRRGEGHGARARGPGWGRPRRCALPDAPRARPRRRLGLRFCHSALGGGGGHLGSGARGAAAPGVSSGAPYAATTERAPPLPSGRAQGGLPSAERHEHNAGRGPEGPRLSSWELLVSQDSLMQERRALSGLQLLRQPGLGESYG